MPPDPERRLQQWWLDSARLVAETVMTLPELGDDAFAVLDPAFARSYDNNRLLLPAVPPGPEWLDPAVAAAAADDVLGGAGLAHRQVAVYDSVPLTWVEGFAALGATRDRVVFMRCPVQDVAIDLVAAARAVEVDGERSAPYLAAEWRETAPEYDDLTVRQLVGRRLRDDRAGVVRQVAVVAPDGDDPAAPAGGLAAHADLLIRGPRAEIDGVGTLLAHRGQGYGDAIVAAALLRAREAGCTEVVLEADADDWPMAWYARRGFVADGVGSSFTWHPAP